MKFGATAATNPGCMSSVSSLEASSGSATRSGSASGPGLTLAADADIMSAVKTFTIRELDREPATVLDACDREGAVRIRRRNGRTYTLRPEAGPDRITALPDFRARMKQIFPKPIPAAQSRLADKLLAGE